MFMLFRPTIVLRIVVMLDICGSRFSHCWDSSRTYRGSYPCLFRLEPTSIPEMMEASFILKITAIQPRKQPRP